MRIGVDMRRMRSTGIGRYARNIFRAMVTEGDQHEYVAVVQSTTDAADVRTLTAGTGNVSCIIEPARQFSPREMLTLPRRVSGVDVWHYPHSYQMGFLRRDPIVLTLMDVIPITHPIGLRNLLAREPIRAVWWRACRRADAFVAISAATADAFHRLFGVPRELIRVTHLAPDPAFAAPSDPTAVARARARWGLPDRVVLYVGMSQSHKNLDRLLQAMALLGRVDADPPGLAIIGPNVAHERAALLRRVHELDIARCVHFLNTLPDEEVTLAYHAADVLVQPSLVEGFGLTVLEAMQCGRPCVASDIPAFREITGGAAVLVDPLDPVAIADGIRRVLDDSAFAAELGARGRAHASRFSWLRTARETLATHEMAVASRGRTADATAPKPVPRPPEGAAPGPRIATPSAGTDRLRR